MNAISSVYRVNLLCLAVFILYPMILPAAEYYVGPEKYRSYLSKLKPGDVLHLSAGHYPFGLALHSMHGTSAKPIIITGPDNGGRAVFRGSAGKTVISLIDASYIHIRQLDINGHNSAFNGIKASGMAHGVHHITLENLFIHNFAGNQQHVGISTKSPAWGWRIRDNTIIAAGTGIYLGNSNGKAAFVNGILENNLIIDSIGYNLQIKHQLQRKHFPAMPLHSTATIIHHNMFSKRVRNKQPGMARPNVLLGHWPLSGSGSNDIYLIYGNCFFGNPDEALFQAEGNLALYDNFFVQPEFTFFPAVTIQPHNSIPRYVSIFNNTIQAPHPGLVLRGRGEAFRRLVKNNTVFANISDSGIDHLLDFMDHAPNTSDYLTASYTQPDAQRLCSYFSRTKGLLERQSGKFIKPPVNMLPYAIPKSGSRLQQDNKCRALNALFYPQGIPDCFI